MFEVTRQWIKANGPWTAAKLEAIGLHWPLEAGWVDSMTLMSITESQKAEVERLHTVQMQKRVDRAKRHERMQNEVYYTWPDGRGSWLGSAKKPPWWDSVSVTQLLSTPHNAHGKLERSNRSGSANNS